MTKRELYNSKKRTVQECLSIIKSGDIILHGAYGHEPVNLLRQLHTIADRVENVNVWTALGNERYPFTVMPGMDGKINTKTVFYSQNAREGHEYKNCTLLPTNLHNGFKQIMCNARPNIYMGAVSSMDEFGFVRCSLDIQWTLEAIDAADIVILEINPNLPLVHGMTQVPIEKATYIIEVDNPLHVLPEGSSTQVEEEIAKYVGSLVQDGDTIQLGIGGMPNAVAHELMAKHDLGIHTEMITSAMARLMKSGAVNGSRKTLHREKTVGAFAFGTMELYEYMDDNPAFQLMPAAYVNDPFVIAKNDNMVSINTTLQIDLTGQVCSESIGCRQYSGTGGASDFAYGAFHSKGGKGIIAISSTAKGGTVSRIQPFLALGSVVTISRNLVDHIVTEYGIAYMRGRTVRQRVDNLIAISHPDFRKELREQADKALLW